MKKSKILSFALVAVLAFPLLLSSCKKDDITLLTAHTWHFDKLTTNSTNPDVQAMVDFTAAFLSGATLDFDEGGTYELNSPFIDQPETGSWELSDDGKTLYMDDDAMMVVKLTDDELVLEGEEVDDELGAYTVKMYWEK